MRVRVVVITEEFKCYIIKVLKLVETIVQKAHSYQKQSGTVSITLYLVLSTDEKSSIIHIEVV